MANYRKIWEESNGPIPKDEYGRSYEIHHIDGNRLNNDISNLMCVSIEDHYKIHLEKKEYGAAFIIAQRLNMSLEEMKIITQQMASSKKGIPSKLKGKKGIFSEETIKKISESVKKLYEKDPIKKKKSVENLRRGIEKAKLENPNFYDCVRFEKEKNHFFGKKHTEETRIKLKKAWEQRKNKTPWNKGLTKENDQRVKEYSEKLSITNKKK
jgi:hypothetical protein